LDQICHLLQPIPVGNVQSAAFQPDKTVSPHLLESAVDVNRRDAERIGELSLG
jgi:hypothetical protein